MATQSKLNYLHSSSILSYHVDRVNGGFFFDEEDIFYNVRSVLQGLAYTEEQDENDRLSNRLIACYHELKEHSDEICNDDVELNHLYFGYLVELIRESSYLIHDFYFRYNDEEQRKNAMMYGTQVIMQHIEAFLSTTHDLNVRLQRVRTKEWFKQLDNRTIDTLNFLFDIRAKVDEDRKVFLLLQENAKGVSNHD